MDYLNETIAFKVTSEDFRAINAVASLLETTSSKFIRDSVRASVVDYLSGYLRGENVHDCDLEEILDRALSLKITELEQFSKEARKKKKVKKR